MAGSNFSSPKNISSRVSNVVVSDAESEYKEDMMMTSSKASRSSARRSRASRRPSISQQHHMKHYVEHNYHDHKYDPVELLPVNNNIQQQGIANKRTGHKGGVSTPFPDKLHELLENVDQQGQDDIIAWQPHGRCFVVHKPREFVSDIMPKFFKQSKLTSFQRQLNLYGFSRLTTGPDRGGYYHELFIRGRSDLCSRMVRTRVKGNGSKAASSPSTEPNFYNMEPCLAGDRVNVITSAMSVDETVEDDIQLFQERDFEEDFARVGTPEPLTSDLGASSEEDLATPISKATTPFWDEDNEGDLGIIDLEKTPNEAKFTSLPPVVTPISTESRKLLRGADNIPPTLPMVVSLDSIKSGGHFDDIHSGDQVFFEGLPFHYLELKDVEDNLIHGEVHCV